MPTQIQIDCLDRFRPLVERRKRIKIIVGGRASTKTTFVADYVSACMANGQLWCCGREFQNSIDESVHRTLSDEIERLGIPGFDISKTAIEHVSGGRAFYRGLARNILSLKGILSGVDGLWIEEGEGLGDDTLRVMTASARATAKDFDQAKKAGIPIDKIRTPEIWITMNRRSRQDPISRKYLARAEKELARCGYYEDDSVMIVQANYNDIPKEWFLASGLEQERADDWENMTRAEYYHKWHGEYLETVDNAIIQPEWFDACIDAHEKLGIEPLGQEKVAYDPADAGDAKALCYMRGILVADCVQTQAGNIDTATDWALSTANKLKPDAFIWDFDGIGGGLKQQVERAFHGKRTVVQAFSGGGGVFEPDMIYQASDSEDAEKAKKNKEMFVNKRAQCYWVLRDRMLKTYQAVEKKRYHDPDQLISISSTIKDIDQLRSEVCQIPRKYIASGRVQILSKAEMKKAPYNLQSPNMADTLMMCQMPVDVYEYDEDESEDYREPASRWY